MPFGGYAQFWIRGQILELFKPKGDALGFGRAVSLNVPANSEDSGDRELKEKLNSLIDEQAQAANIDVSDLNERERRVFVARIEGETLDTLGGELGVSRERVRQIGARATEKVRTTKGNVARTCIRDLLGRRGYQKPSRRLLPDRQVSYPGQTYSQEEIAVFTAECPDTITQRSTESESTQRWWSDQRIRWAERSAGGGRS